MSRCFAVLAFVVALLAVAAHSQTYDYFVSYSYYNNAACSANSGTTTVTYANGSCAELSFSTSTDISCSETGGSSGNICDGLNCNGSCGFYNHSDKVWDQVACQITGVSSSQGVTCLRTLIPAAPVAPVAEPVAEPIAAPIAEPIEAPIDVPEFEPVAAPVAPVAPTAPTTSPADGALITHGNVSVAFWFSTNCASNAVATISLFANYSKCQAYTNGATTYFFRADCYTTGFSKVSGCEDATCTSCADLPSTESGTCFVVSGFNPLNSATIKCPALAPSAAPSVVASFVFVAVAILAVALF